MYTDKEKDMIVLKGKRFTWNGVNVEVTRVAKSGDWADIQATIGATTVWTKRQPLPFPDSFVPVK